MPTTPYTYLDLQILFQDSYEASAKTLGLSNWILSSDTILNYVYNSELQILHELAINKQYHLLRGHTITEDVSGTLAFTLVPNVIETGNVECNYFIKAYSTVVSTYPNAATFTGVLENEEILPEDAGIYYQTAFNVPYFKTPKIYIEPVNSYVVPEAFENKFIVIVDGYTVITGLTITYIKLPSKPAITDSCFSDYTLYNRIIELAVNKAMADLAKLSSPKNKEA